VLPQDVQEIAKDVLRHRLVLTYEGLAEGLTPDALLDRIIAAVPAPRIDLGRTTEGWIPANTKKPVAAA
jgi:MoxR-like ATPase